MKLIDRWETGLEDDPKGRIVINKGKGKTLGELMQEEKERKEQKKAKDEKKQGF